MRQEILVRMGEAMLQKPGPFHEMVRPTPTRRC
jgi:hypothetical protein